ncbi:MAG: prepilin-type N-terminal cleavage/methylation domain-containing protein [Labilithrix sp.]|nr:prepilin-type N-terminal cleavage/methylation domain-containing protein [Labilithrix sp.]MCW5834130.1 prepilin-type N-terminal cleavage/methylation domain-containing protein [Labilithrix sp.]
MTSSLARLRAATRRARRGYTVVEVMSAMTLFAIGAAGVIGMQRVTIQGGADARNFDTATNIAREWQHRLQRDALAWTQPNSLVTSSNIDNTVWLHNANINNTWLVPAVTTPLAGNSAAFDLLGRDVAPNSPDRVFCVQYRLAWIADNQSGSNITGLIRAEIRVFWSRLEFGPPDCSDLAITAAGTRERHHIVNVTTAIRGNPKE